MHNGILVLDKIYGAPSRGCVTSVSRALGGKRQKVGHAGTLDTTASGTLVLMLGNATRLCEQVMNLPKTYLAEVEFGWETTTDDATGEPISEPIRTDYDEKALKTVLPRFLGVRMQVPPRVSAVRVAGVRAHKIARSGREPNITPRPISITSIRYLGVSENRCARLLVSCHRGTYIRSLARDIGRELGLKAHLSSLRRINIGNYNAKEGLPFNPQEPPSPDEIAAHIQPIETLARQYYCYKANPFCEKRLTNGLCVYASYLTAVSGGIVPASLGVMVVGESHICLGKLRCENGRAVISPQSNFPKEVQTA